ncbi:MAG TPA: CHAT domain-containing tetratricopeptide repeat protein, partial [Thermoanaerobaculia bacterium]|nr:CHAT domain-containing tetratricopeptide repeat protein [Thermoanaerobaculia bacterium]
RAARLIETGGPPDEVQAAFREAAAAAREARRPLFEAIVRHRQGSAALARQDWTEAEASFRASLRLRRQAAPDSLAVSASLNNLGYLLLLRERLEEAHRLLDETVRLRSRLAPGSVALASSLNMLAQMERSRGLSERSGRHFRAALAIIRHKKPGSPIEIDLLNNLAVATRDLGDLATAVSYMQQAWELQQRLSTEDMNAAGCLMNLGALEGERGDLEAAEEHLNAALRRLEGLDTNEAMKAMALSDLGLLAQQRYDFDRAEALYRGALAIQEKDAPGTVRVATTLNKLSAVLGDQGRLREAEAAARRALAIAEKDAPGGEETASSLSQLGSIALQRGNLHAAQASYARALAVRRAAALGSSFEAQLLERLGSVAERRGDRRQAEALYRESVALRLKIAPESGLEAEAFHHLGLVLWKEGRLDEAGASLAAALDAVERQIGRLGGSDEARSGFHGASADMYLSKAELDLEQGRPAAALHTLERWRARSLLEMLAERDLVFKADVPAPLLARQRRLDREQQSLQQKIAGLDSAREMDRVEELRLRLAGVRDERAALARKIARTSPRYASLRHPQPLDLPAIRQALDPGTLWLSYGVTPEKTLLFVVTPEGDGRLGEEGVEVFVLPLGRRKLASEVEVFRSLILRGREEPRLDPALLAAGRRLFDLLMAPAAAALEGADRLLISPDGPLHELPFAALVRPGEEPSFLVEWKPVHEVLSATLFAEIRKGRRPRAGSLVAFGDPATRQARPNLASASSLRLRTGRLTSLPFARMEVNGIAELYGPDATVYLGPEATEERVRHPGVEARQLHFASHALLDRRFPLESALVLSPAGGDDGLLQAWEVFEKVRLDADLVTLSACETGLGEDAGGEGLIGLTRAFQYAGARSVLASLWSVSDRSTAFLMRRFYAELRKGVSKDEALRQAQLGLIREGRGKAAHPFYWAAFELTGDWR